jgi:hypothetical protein
MRSHYNIPNCQTEHVFTNYCVECETVLFFWFFLFLFPIEFEQSVFTFISETVFNIDDGLTLRIK